MSGPLRQVRLRRLLPRTPEKVCSRARHRFLLILVISAAFATSARADLWNVHYERAAKAARAEDWREVVQEITLALEKKGDSDPRARTYGMNFTGYFPYYRLGVAYYHLGQLDAALQAFETEEQLGAIAESERDHTELKRLRSLILEEQENAAAAARQRIQAIVDDSVARASRLEGEGRLEEAIQALGEALAVAPEHEEATETMERLRSGLARQQAERELAGRVAKMVDDGRQALAAGRLDEASSLFDQALSLQPTEDIRALRDDALVQLRERIETMEDEARRASIIEEGLLDARSAADSGDHAKALARLQPVLALEPGNADALVLQGRLLRLKAAEDLEQSNRQAILGLETEAEARFEAGEYEQSLVASNRLLALDSGNETALSYIARSYRELNRKLLGTGAAENFPPAIRFADSRESQLDDGLRLELVDESWFRLTGTIYDDVAVDLVFEVVTPVSPGLLIEGRQTSQQVGANTLTEFSLDHILAPGLTVFRVVATDPEGSKSSSEYAVLYVRPFHRTPWPYLGSIAIVVAVAALAYSRRVRRRNQMRKRRFNPYVAGAPVVNPDLFFGREPLIDRILQTIHNNSLLLFGERRIGKTSIQHHLKRRLVEVDDPKYDFYPAYIDLQGTPEEKFFSTMALDIFEDLAPVLGELKPSSRLTDGDAYSYRDFVRDLREIFKVLKRRSEKTVKLVLLIDEVDELNDYDPRVNQKLRSLFMKSFAENLVAVVSGVGIKKHWESEGSPWYNFFEEIEVKPLTREEAGELIRRPVGDIFKLEHGAVERIVELTDCRPYLIQKLCINLVDRLHKANRRTITVADVDEFGRPDGA